jgi:hypothetical protein
MMSNKPHLRPHQKKRQASWIIRLLMAVLIVAIFALAIALEATGHIVFRGRLILLREQIPIGIIEDYPKVHYSARITAGHRPAAREF